MYFDRPVITAFYYYKGGTNLILILVLFPEVAIFRSPAQLVTSTLVRRITEKPFSTFSIDSVASQEAVLTNS